MVVVLDVDSINDVNNFNKKIKGMHTMVLYYSDNCDYCREMRPHWDDFVKKAENKKGNVLVARVNSKLMDYVHADKDVQGYPTIYYLFDGNKEDEFTKERKENNFMEFLNNIITISHGTAPFKSPKKSRSKSKSKSRSKSKSKSRSKPKSRSKSKSRSKAKSRSKSKSRSKPKYNTIKNRNKYKNKNLITDSGRYSLNSFNL